MLPGYPARNCGQMSGPSLFGFDFSKGQSGYMIVLMFKTGVNCHTFLTKLFKIAGIKLFRKIFRSFIYIER